MLRPLVGGRARAGRRGDLDADGRGAPPGTGRGHGSVGPGAALDTGHHRHGDPERALALVRPLFEKPERLDERDAASLNTLLEAYDALDLQEEHWAEAERLAGALRPSLRAVLWESLARSYAVEGEMEEAWKSLERARQDDPESPALGPLEVSLLLAEGKTAEAGERARYWRSRLREARMVAKARAVALLVLVLLAPLLPHAPLRAQAPPGPYQYPILEESRFFAENCLKRARESGRPLPPSHSPNILFIVLDTVRADRLSLYGYERPSTPNLERLSKP